MAYFLYFVIIISFFDNFSQLPIISPYAQELGGSSFLIGLAVGIYSFSNMLGNIVAGRWIDKTGRKKIIVLGMLIAGSSMLCYAFVNTATQLVLVRLLHGVGGGLLVPAVFTYFSDQIKDRSQGKSMAYSGAAIGIAAIIGPAYTGIMSQKFGLNWVFFSIAAIVFLTVLLVIVFLPENYKKRNTGEIKGYFPKPKEHSLLNKAYLGSFSLMFSVGILTLVLPLKVKELGMGSASTGMLMSTYGLAAIVFFLLPTNQLSDRLGRIKPMVYGILMISSALLLLSQVQRLPFLLGAMTLYGAGFAILFPAMNSLVVDETTTEERGRAFGLFYAFFSLGVVVGPLTVGALNVTPDQGFLIGSASLLILAYLIHRRKTIPASS